ncbi:DUF6879 family protein [Mangrovihabitans endophyticus]|uniref:DUF6879 domain-containing protein n=1 Tax=Mangrovihabitans endophyticus TaxID=1751298 RepID=A0A8J3FMV4_9ACTN|nr:DUF6879 family protein [Mangrovihabitans endophyticus]GGK86402.1 hypothetical protein GCM10012284_20790 [Mangrovihabitans endophyticus]
MPDLLDGAEGERMELDAYYADFEKNFWTINELGFWKLERQQFFKEPGYDSWEAFARGDWDASLGLLEAGRADMAAYHRRVEEHGFAAYRVRVVEEPITAYLQWELHALRIRDQCGGSVHIVGPQQVAEFEHLSALPEIYTLGTSVMYQAIYDDTGVLESVRRFTDRDLIVRCQRFIQDLYEAGQPLEPFFVNHVATLPPPTSHNVSD